MKKLSKGFTLIELLIVIALLGALAVALLAALDPLEQIKKGTDTGVRNTVSEIHSSIVRYTSLQGGQLPFTGTLPFQAVGTNTAGVAHIALQKVIDQGELKSDFMQLSGKQLESVFMTGINESGVVVINVCYAPTAKSFKTDLNTKFYVADSASGSVTESGTAAADCPQASGTNAGGNICYWCVR